MSVPDNIAAIVVAGGSSQRFGSENKLLARLDGIPLVEHTFRSVVDSGFRVRFVVTSVVSQPAIEAIAERHSFDIIVNANAEQGLGSSIASGVREIPASVEGFAIFLGDMPFIQRDSIVQVSREFHNQRSQAIVRPRVGKAIGHPVFFPASLREQLSCLDGEEGAGAVIRSNRHLLRLVDVDDAGIREDIDTKDDLVDYESGKRN